MNKRINLIVGSGVLGAYLSAELLRKKEKVVVTTRSLKKIRTNYNYLKIQKKIKFEKLNINKKKQISKIISKYNPKKIFYFAGQSSITKSIKYKKETFSSHYNGTKNFLEILKKEKSNIFDELLIDVIVLDSKPPVQDSAKEILIFLFINFFTSFLAKIFIIKHNF